MAAGSGFKTFTTGDVLTASDVNGYLMQNAWVFADAAARTAAVTSPQQGNLSFLKSTNSLEYYSGSAWTAVGGGGGGGGFTLLSTTTCAGTSTTISSISQSYKYLYGVITGLTTAAGYVEALIKLNGDASNHTTGGVVNGSGVVQSSVWNLNEGSAIAASGGTNGFTFQVNNYASTTTYKPYSATGGFVVWDGASPSPRAITLGGVYRSTSAITSITVNHTNIATGGTILLYGAN
jgi:hypothetical protein